MRFVFIAVFSFCFLYGIGFEEYNSWMAPDPKTQIVEEGLDDLKGAGRVFLPAMTSTESEPFYYVLDKYNNEVASANMGASVFVRPGHYIVSYGSGPQNMLMQQELNVYAEHTSFPEIDWGVLRVNIIDESRNSLNSSYEIFDKDGESYGIGYGAIEEVGEKLRAWVLKPGLYKIVFNSLSFNTYVDFITVEIRPGTLQQRTIVLDSETGKLRGAGFLLEMPHANTSSAWRISSQVHTNANLTSDNSTDQDHPDTKLSFIGQLDNRFVYEEQPYHYTVKHLMELGVTKESDTSFRLSADNFSLKNTFIYYFMKNVGAYTRADVSTHFFKSYIYTQDDKNYIKINKEGDIAVRKNVRRLYVAPELYPLDLKEGAGLNIRFFNQPKANLNLRVGYGIRQEYNKDVYTYDGDVTDSLSQYKGYARYKELSSSIGDGVEVSVVGNFQITSNVNLNSNADILFPFDSNEAKVVDWDNVLNIRLFKYLSFDYKVNISYNEAVKNYTVLNHSLYLRLTYFLY